MLNIFIAQINPTIGDIDGNIALMRDAAAQATKARADVVVFPELSLTGYYPADLLDESGFRARLRKGLSDLVAATTHTPGLTWIVGAPTERAADAGGKRFHNTLLVLSGGATIDSYHKQLLPTYGVFDEARHFAPGPDVGKVVKIGATRVGLMICEDGWNDEALQYAVNPFKRLADARPDLIISINASPSNIGKRALRHDVFAAACAKYELPLVYVNQVGGHDQLVFDGSSFAVSARGEVVYESKRFEEHLDSLVFDTQQGAFAREHRVSHDELTRAVSRAGLDTSEFYRQQIVLGIKDYMRRCGFTKAVVGCSGGIDSAVVLALAVQAVGPSNVVALGMPSRFSSTGSVSDSVSLCQNLGVEFIEHPIEDVVKAYESGFSSAFKTALQGLSLENLQARARGTILMEYSNTFGHLLLTTGNKSEISVGYCTLYGDTNGGLGPIGDLYKTEVFSLARHINAHAGKEIIPLAIIDKEPSAELAPGQRDSDSLPPYPVLDAVLRLMIEEDYLDATERQQAKIVHKQLAATTEGAQIIERIMRLVSRSEYKRRQAAPLIRVRGRAFGTGRQVPIAAVHY